MPSPSYRSWQIKHDPKDLRRVHYVVWQGGRPLGELHPTGDGWTFDGGRTVFHDFRAAVYSVPEPGEDDAP